MGSQYRHEVSKYEKKDALIALCFYAYVCAVLYLFGTLDRLFDRSLGDFALHLISTGLIVVPCFVLILLRKQGIASIGIHTRNLGPALRAGLLLSVLVLLLRSILPGLISGLELQPFSHIIYMLFLCVTVAILEDTMFTGYIQTRIYGLIKNDLAAVLTVAFLFAFLHIISMAGFFGASAFGSIFSWAMLFWIAMHIIWNLLFRRYFSLFPITMLHIAWNFGSPGSIFIQDEHVIHLYPFPALLLAMAIWLLSIHRRGRKGSRKASITELNHRNYIQQRQER